MNIKNSKTQNQALNGLFLLFFIFVSFAFVTNSYAQSVLEKGTIVDNSGMPVPVASIIIKSIPTGVVQSDFDGNCHY